mmetsp:Transcript_11206/g.41951  ORF Transcript_11206/g.41951 Transcript_11206/m.41951 type:complete len:107 (+) Transcript_11206:1250-1570(+)
METGTTIRIVMWMVLDGERPDVCQVTPTPSGELSTLFTSHTTQPKTDRKHIVVNGVHLVICHWCKIFMLHAEISVIIFQQENSHTMTHKNSPFARSCDNWNAQCEL